jgi:hypothetical protein
VGYPLSTKDALIPAWALRFRKTSRSVLSLDLRFTGTNCHGTVRSERWTSSAVYITNTGWNTAWLEPSKVFADDRRP